MAVLSLRQFKISPKTTDFRESGRELVQKNAVLMQHYYKERMDNRFSSLKSVPDKKHTSVYRDQQADAVKRTSSSEAVSSLTDYMTCHNRNYVLTVKDYDGADFLAACLARYGLKPNGVITMEDTDDSILSRNSLGTIVCVPPKREKEITEYLKAHGKEDYFLFRPQW